MRLMRHSGEAGRSEGRKGVHIRFWVRSGGPLHWDRATLPEILVSSIEFGAAEGHDGIRAGLGPVHAGAFQASADGDLAARFDDTGGRAELLRVKLRIAYPVSVVAKVFGALKGFFVVRTVTEQRLQECVESAFIQLVVPSLNPLRAWLAGGAVN